MTDDPDEAYCHALDRISRANRRRWMRQQRADALRFAREAKAAGTPVQSATIAGVTYEFGEPAKSAVTPTTELNEWDRDLGAHSPSSLRQ